MRCKLHVYPALMGSNLSVPKAKRQVQFLSVPKAKRQVQDAHLKAGENSYLLKFHFMKGYCNSLNSYF